MTAARKLCKGEFQVQTNSEFRATANKANNGPSNNGPQIQFKMYILQGNCDSSATDCS